MSERKQNTRNEQAHKIFQNNEAKKKKKVNLNYCNGQIVFN